MHSKSDKGLNKYGIRYIVRLYLSLVAMVFVFFLSAGRVNILRAWIFFVILFVSETIDVIILCIKFPDFLNNRGKEKNDVEAFDKVIRPMYNIIAFYGVIMVAGLDIGRFRWSTIDTNFIFPGVMLIGFADALTIWAILNNPYFESVVRIQKDRSQRIVTSGPYKYIRHPGYLGLILTHVGYPLIIGSLYAYLPTIIGIGLLVARTYLEDLTLQRELKGYVEYSQRVKYRLLPGVW
ncbi:MAG: isoprenylcysteine carboxylmethyltransferase family protein [Thermoplasmata archaeon]|nr:MAG: isoprenylcysteine carboxylmethyltransferase family protein [Thermoplasmata archaeon]RLF59632.1 MAG: isoprenylcysteine carboxylmethyltransferase family protein [Thermoplasmata archaeon]